MVFCAEAGNLFRYKEQGIRMATKNKVLKFLEENRANYVSGQELANSLGLSRAAIWKSIAALKKEGYQIDASTKKGYKLESENDLLSDAGIRIHLAPDYQDCPITVLATTKSTNADAKKLGIDGAPHGSIVTADEQIQGRGRFGRSFASPKGKGIYLSVLLRPAMDLLEVSFSTILTVVAVSRALRKFSDQDIAIKWVNDLYIGRKKISGILTELVSDMESGKVDFVVCGIGININAEEEDFPEEIRDIAGSVQVNTNRNRLIAEIVNELLDVFEHFDKQQIVEEYRRQQLLIGKEIEIVQSMKNKRATALDIDDEGHLIVECEGKTVALQSGEVSVRF